MDERIQKDNTKTSNINNTGSAWVICKSKSHPGINYYFNTLTGKAVWNLSDAEIEKARVKTQLLEGQLGNDLQKCPEPKEPLLPPPPQNSNFPFQNTNFSIQSGVMLLDPQCSGQAENAPQFYNSLGLINAVPVNIAIPGFNSNGWPVPPQTQFIVNPFINQMHPNHPSMNSNPTRYQNMNKHQYSNYNFRGQNNQGSNNRFIENHNSNFESDLRQKLETTRNKYQRPNYTQNKLQHKNNGNVVNIKDHTQISENITKVDLTPLRKLSPLETLHNRWYIVVDTNTILNNFGFLTNLTDSDETCDLMVPRCVMEQLKHIAKENVNARRILRFLTQQIETGLVKSEEKHENDIPTNIFNLCVRLSLEKHHVVLLSDDVNLLKYKGLGRVTIMTVFELKKLLQNGNYHLPLHQNQPPRKVTMIPNNVENPINQKAPNVNIQKNHECNYKQKINASEKISDSKTRTNNPTQNKLNEFNSNISHSQDSHKTELNKTILTKTPSVESEATENRLNVDSNRKDKDIQGDGKVKLLEKLSSCNQTIEKDKIAEVPMTRKRIINLRQNLNVSESSNKKKRWTLRKRCNENIKSADNPPLQPTIAENTNVNAAVPEKTNSATDNQIIDEHVKNMSENVEFNNDCSSSNSVIITKNVGENVVIDESSMSGIISNTESNADLESLFNYKTKFISEAKKPVQRNVMVEIPSTIVEEHLSMRCEEWMFRFTQIMEEALSQILQQDPPFVNSDFPPPWTLHEATQCIIKKFSHCCYVVDAANKLSIVLHELSDGKGKISGNVKPAQYMEMYSYGIYLIKALQDIKNYCEDLRTASNLLKKLLDDIHNPTIDNITNDIFVEDTPSTSETFMTPRTPDNPSIPKSSEIPRNPEVVLKSPNAKERGQSFEEQNSTKSTTEVIDSIISSQSKTNSKENEPSTVPNVNTDINDSSTPVFAPKIIRVFTTCPEFENRSELDYDWDDEGDIFNDQYDNDYNEGNLDLGDESQILEDPVESDDTKMKQLFSIISKEIKETYSEVMALCDTSCKDLLDINVSDEVKSTIGVRAGQVRSHINNLCKSFESILDRDRSHPDENIHFWLKKAGLEMDFDQKLCDDYKTFIKNCKDQAETFITSIDIIIDAAKL